MDGQNQREERTDSQNAAEEAVLAFYARMAYPAPLTSLDEHRELYRHPERRRPFSF
jgi:hypothetical protein